MVGSGGETSRKKGLYESSEAEALNIFISALRHYISPLPS